VVPVEAAFCRDHRRGNIPLPEKIDNSSEALESTASRAGKAALRAVLFLSATGEIFGNFSLAVARPSLYYR
jgi:hypothetical protein